VSIKYPYTLYEIDSNFPDVTGQNIYRNNEESRWYLYNESSPFGFYLAPLHYDSIDERGDHIFNFEDVDDALLLNDDSLWLITGRLSNNAATDGNYKVSIIKSLDLTVSYTGQFSEQILYVHGAGLAFFIKQVN
jgi:hypothetical protein